MIAIPLNNSHFNWSEFPESHETTLKCNEA